MPTCNGLGLLTLMNRLSERHPEVVDRRKGCLNVLCELIALCGVFHQRHLDFAEIFFPEQANRLEPLLPSGIIE